MGIPKATAFNETVFVDVKNMSSLVGDPSDKRFVLYLIDEFTKYSRGVVIPNKEKETVVFSIIQEWCLTLCGHPSRSFHNDNGGEFLNESLREFASREGIKITSTQSGSAFASTGNERGHEVIESLFIKKLLEDDTELSLEEALDHALYASNIEIGQLGISPQQLAFGQGSVIPGISGRNGVTNEAVNESESVRKHFRNQQHAREVLLKAEISARTKKAPNNRISKHNDAKHDVGDKVFFEDEHKKWQGPAEVIITNGRTTWLKWQGILYPASWLKWRGIFRKSYAGKMGTFYVEDDEPDETDYPGTDLSTASAEKHDTEDLDGAREEDEILHVESDEVNTSDSDSDSYTDSLSDSSSVVCAKVRKIIKTGNNKEFMEE